MTTPVGGVQEDTVPVVSSQPTTSGHYNNFFIASKHERGGWIFREGEGEMNIPRQLVEHDEVGEEVQYVLQELNVEVSHSSSSGSLSGLLGSRFGGMPPDWSGSIPFIPVRC